MVAREIVPFIVVSIVVAVACVTDLKSFRIPNWLTLPLALSGLAFHTVAYGLAGVQNSILGLLFGALVLMLLYVIGGMGAGDVKLLAGVGAWLGIPAILYVFIVAAAVGGVYSFTLLILQGRLISAFTAVRVVVRQLAVMSRHLGTEERVESVVKYEDRRKRLVPFAVMIAIGVIVVMVGLHIM